MNYEVVLARGFVQLIRSADPPKAVEIFSEREKERPKSEVVVRKASSAAGFSPSARRALGRLFLSLPWEMLGNRVVMVTLTAPPNWRRFCGNNDVWNAQVRALAERWSREWGERLIGVWVKEFQGRGAPHLHMYVKLPGLVGADEYEALQLRTVARKKAELARGKYEARSWMRPVEGRFGLWLRKAWTDVVTGNQTRKHYVFGVDIATEFWTDEVARTANRVRIAEYLWRESAKMAQKRPPEGFGEVRNYYGVWGRGQGFRPVVWSGSVPVPVARRIERVLCRWLRLRLGEGGSARFGPTRFWGDGLTVFGLTDRRGAAVVCWAYRRAGLPLADVSTGELWRREDMRVALLVDQLAC